MSDFVISCACFLSLITAGFHQAVAQDHAVVPAYERFRSQQLTLGQAGRLLISELNCRSCHDVPVSSTLAARSAPVLTDVANRVTVEYLRKFIQNPQAVKPGTAMPRLVAQSDNIDAIEALVHFLASDGVAVESPVSAVSVSRGEKLFHSVGCAACHGDHRVPVDQRPPYAMPLGPVDTKYTVGSLTGFITNPHAVRPSGRMPSLNLKAEEAQDIANYLLQEIDVAPNISVSVYEGNWQSLPDFSELTPKAKLGVTSFDVQVASRKDGFGLRFDGFLHLPASGKHRFFLGSDDGSRLLVDGQQIVDVDGIHPHTVKDGRTDLTSGPHAVVVEYFEGGGHESLSVEIEGPGLPRQNLAGLMSLTDEPPEDRRSFQPNASLVARGKELFSTLGCASCHEHGKGENRIASLLKAPSLGADNARAGCLATAASNAVPQFALSDTQRQDIIGVLTRESGQSTEAEQGVANNTISEVMLTLNCYACHQRDQIGGVAREMDGLFEGTIPEMGDEGRIPPHLDGVGDKLAASWLDHVLNEGAKDRPYMLTRMPKFGKANVGRLVEEFSKTDARTEVAEVTFEDPAHRVEAEARLMVGDQALSCIKCHTFDKYKATGIQSLDMTTMTRRLRRDWFHRYLLNPQAFRPGTRMPAAWPNGRTVVPHILHGDSSQQLEAIWRYLSAGAKAKVPSGLVVNAIELKPLDRPIIYRNFIEGLSPRGIAVGYPQKAHIAWDAEQMNLRLIWHGAFIDASKHWVGRGPGYQAPMGDHVMQLKQGAPLAVLANFDAAWPLESAREQGYRFKGYTLDTDGQPAFEYEWQGIQVNDFILPEEAKPDATLMRTIQFTASDPVPGLYLRLAADSKITTADSAWRIGDAIQIQMLESKPILRQHKNTQELLVPISFDSTGKATVRYRMIW